jgi:hypothetical protein
MEKIKLSIVGLLLSGLSYGQTTKECCVKTVKEVYEYEGMVVSKFRKDSVKISYQELSNMWADLDDVISMMEEDENNGDYSHGSIEEQWGQIYWMSLVVDRLEEILSEHGHKSHLNK